jgi:hypothetical protein
MDQRSGECRFHRKDVCTYRQRHNVKVCSWCANETLGLGWVSHRFRMDKLDHGSREDYPSSAPLPPYDLTAK